MASLPLVGWLPRGWSMQHMMAPFSTWLVTSTLETSTRLFLGFASCKGPFFFLNPALPFFLVISLSPYHPAPFGPGHAHSCI